MKPFAGLALVGVVVAGCPLDAGAGAVEVKVSLLSDCVSHTVVPAKVAVSKSRDDVLVWRFASACAKPIKVYVCPKQQDPLLDCAGTAFAVLRKPFTIYHGGSMGPTSAVLCPVNWSVLDANPTCTPSRDCPKFSFQAVNGPATGGDPTCPPIRASELELEVQP